MIKEKKALKIALSLVVAGAVLMGAGYLFGGFKTIYGNSNGINIYDSKDIVNEKKTIDNFQNINLNVDYSDVEIVKGEKYEIETAYNKSLGDIEYNVSENTLNINRNNGKHLSFNVELFGVTNMNNSSKIKIYVPYDSSLSDIKCQIGSGNINIKDLSFKNADVACDYGDAEFSNIGCTSIKIHEKSGDIKFDNIDGSEIITTSEYGDVKVNNFKSESFTCDLKAGNMDFNSLTTGNGIITNSYGDIRGYNVLSNGLNITSNSGNIDIAGELKGNNTINSEYGDVDLESSLSEKDYSYDLTVKFGNCSVNGKDKEDVCKKAETSSDNSINAVCKSGDLKVNFQNKH